LRNRNTTFAATRHVPWL